MKKHLVVALALVFVLSLSSAAFAAANPFVDVPAKHWAYDAVSQLAKAGIVDGYNDGTFRGDKTMTRYEMAQIVAKAMAKEDKADAATKATIDKLAVEFAAELNNLGVRVTKLEQNQSTIKFTGDARLRYVATENDANNPAFAERVRIVATANVNDNTSFYMRWMAMNHNLMGTYGTKVDRSHTNGQQGDGSMNFISDANLTTKGILPNIDVTAGRYSLNLGPTTYLAGSTGMFDGVYATWKNGKTSIMTGYADANAVNDYYTASVFKGAGNTYYAELNYKFSPVVKANFDYVKTQENNNVTTTDPSALNAVTGNDDVVDLMGGGLVWNMNKDWALTGEYYENSSDYAKTLNANDNAALTIARLSYKGVKASVPHSWGAFFEYVKAEPGAIDGNWTGAMVNVTGKSKINGASTATWAGLKAYDFQFSYALAKNITADAIYQFNMKPTVDGAADFAGDNYTRIQINYNF